ncbi:MAG TPA: anthranilate phosphoribosyltransferase [Planctomycetota bacterium]|jgi:anthranilate phosphoribosyltransferase
MFDRFTDRARKVFSYARKEAERLKHNYIGTEHVLLGLLMEGSGVAANVLENMGVDLEAARLQVAKVAKPTPGDFTKDKLPFTHHCKRALEFTIDEARALDHQYVGTEHLLLGLLREPKCRGAEVLMKLGLKLEDVRTEVLEFLGAEVLQPLASPQIPMSFPISRQLEILLSRRDLSREEATELMTAIVEGRAGGASIAGIAIALRAKGESVEELAAFASVMRERAVHVKVPVDTLDTCGTGGDASGTFNISTATALVAAGMGIHVAKHGGRSASSKSGSADVLTALGVKIEVSPSCVERCISEAGIGFLFAPAHHPAMKHVAPVRKELGVRTIFNLIGPLSNPAGAAMQLLGVCEPSLCEKFARVLMSLGSRSAMVICGAGPGGTGCLDEMSTFGPTHVARIKDGKLSSEDINAKDFGIPVPAADALCAADTNASAEIVRGVLSGKEGPARDIVVLNAAAAGLVAEKASDWKAALELARESIDSGRANAALEKLVKLTNEG